MYNFRVDIGHQHTHKHLQNGPDLHSTVLTNKAIQALTRSPGYLQGGTVGVQILQSSRPRFKACLCCLMNIVTLSNLLSFTALAAASFKKKMFCPRNLMIIQQVKLHQLPGMYYLARKVQVPDPHSYSCPTGISETKGLALGTLLLPTHPCSDLCFFFF